MLLWYLNYLVLEYVVFFDSLVQHLGVPEFLQIFVFYDERGHMIPNIAKF